MQLFILLTAVVTKLQEFIRMRLAPPTFQGLQALVIVLQDASIGTSLPAHGCMCCSRGLHVAEFWL